MNKREATRIACLIACANIENYMGTGSLRGSMSDDDAEKVSVALNEIAQRLFDRGARVDIPEGIVGPRDAAAIAGVKLGKWQ